MGFRFFPSQNSQDGAGLPRSADTSDNGLRPWGDRTVPSSISGIFDKRCLRRLWLRVTIAANAHPRRTLGVVEKAGHFLCQLRRSVPRFDVDRIRPEET